MPTASAPVVLADIGGTNARFALARDGEILHGAHLAVADYPGPREALDAFLAGTGPLPAPRRAALAVAGPVEGETARLTNSPWRVAAAELQSSFGFDQVILVNDFAAVAWAVPRLGAGDLVSIGAGHARAQAPVAVIGPGTGLGVAGLIQAESGPVVLVTEGGHVTMAPADEREADILASLRRRYGHVSAERVLSGDGLVNLFATLAELEGWDPASPTAAEITRRALAGADPRCAAALDAFCAMLGTVAGNLALTLGALGGVYIAGGVVPRFADYLAASKFRARFESKGRFRDYLAKIPTRVVSHSDPAFLGLAALLGIEINN
jgi:glucokinase